MTGGKINMYNINHTSQDHTKGSFNLYLYPHAPILPYNEGMSSIDTVQINNVTLFVTWVHKDPILFHEGG